MRVQDAEKIDSDLGEYALENCHTPIPIFTTQKKEDFLIHLYKEGVCPRFDAISLAIKNSEEFKAKGQKFVTDFGK